jgi:hypothetical protein
LFVGVREAGQTLLWYSFIVRCWRTYWAAKQMYSLKERIILI